MNDTSRVYDGFSALPGGMNGGIAASLIAPSQCAGAVNFTFRDGYPKTRPGWTQLPLTFDDPVTQERFAGNFQGSAFYKSEVGEDGFVIMVGGRLFFLTLGLMNLVVEITPLVAITTAELFMVPALNGTVDALVNSAGVLAAGQIVYVGPGQFRIQAISGDELVLRYLGGMPGTVPKGTSWTDQNFKPLSLSNSSTFTVPAIGGSVTVPVSSGGTLIVNALTIQSGHYTITSLDGDNIIAQYTGGVPTTVPAGTPVVDETTPVGSVVVAAQYVIPAVNSTVQIQVNNTTGFTPLDTLLIQSGTYSLVSVDSMVLMTIKFLGGFPTTVPPGTAVLSNVGATLTTTAQTFTIPSVGGTVSIPVHSTALLTYQVYAGFGLYTITAISGLNVTMRLVEVDIPSGTALEDLTMTPLQEFVLYPASYDFAHLFQAENYMIVLGGQQPTIVWDGTMARPTGPGELPSATFGFYVWGRIWLALPNRRSFVAGDLVYGPSGTAALGFRDAILKMTENSLLNGGGSFSVPSSAGLITGMTALATQDTSLGQGNLLVGTTGMVFSVNTPTDRTTWQNVTYPIQTIGLLEYGPQGPRWPTINGDWWFRALDGFRAFLVARRDIGVWGNTPMSLELSPVLDFDTNALLLYGSGMMFDNKFFATVSPVRTGNGVAHRGLAVLNFDLLSQITRGELLWEGVSTGLDIFQVVKGSFDDGERGIAFALNNGAIEVWELKADGEGTADVSALLDSFDNADRATAIQAWLETRSYPFGDGSQLKEIITSELFLDQITDECSVTVKYRPDQKPGWVTWATIPLCAAVSQCAPAPGGAANGPDGAAMELCTSFTAEVPQYAARIMLPRPADEDCNKLSGRPPAWGYEFQFRLELNGYARIRKWRVHAKMKPDKNEGECPPEKAACDAVADCGTDWFTYDSHGQAVPASNL